MHWEWGSEGGGDENCKIFSKSRYPEITDGNYEYNHRMCIIVLRIFSQDYNSNEIRFFKEQHGHSSPERSAPAYGQNYTVQDNKRGGFSVLLRLTAIKQGVGLMF